MKEIKADGDIRSVRLLAVEGEIKSLAKEN